MVETFQADKEGCYSPIQRDDNKDGIQDAYDEIGVDVAEMNETIELLLDEKTYNKINKYGRVVENNDIKYVYHLKMGDDIEKYYDLNGNKIININNILYSRNVMEIYMQNVLMMEKIKFITNIIMDKKDWKLLNIMVLNINMDILMVKLQSQTLMIKRYMIENYYLLTI